MLPLKKMNSELPPLGEVEKKETVLIAGGEFGPLGDWITETLKEGTGKDIRLFFGANSQQDLNGQEKLKDLSELSDNFTMVTALNSSNPEWKGEVGLITDVVRDKLDPNRVDRCLLYGTPVMVEETKLTLTELGVPDENIYYKTLQRNY